MNFKRGLGFEAFASVYLITFVLLFNSLQVNSLIYVGCYESSTADDVFAEDGLNLQQCTTASSSISGNCFAGNNPYYKVNAFSMTVDKCSQICITTYGYIYAGLNNG